MQLQLIALSSMINRIIIRIKVLQVIYAYYQKESNDLKGAESELMLSLQKAYDLYHYLLALISVLTDAEQKRLDIQKHKLLATEKEKNPNTKFIDNLFAEQLRTNIQLQKFTNEKGFLWDENDSAFIKNLLKTIIGSDIYAEYLTSKKSYESDRDFWRKVFKNIILEDEKLTLTLEDKSIYWQDDLDIVGTFVIKTIKRFSLEEGVNQELLPMFKEEEDLQFAKKLLRSSIIEKEENNERIIRHIKNWDFDRIAGMDLFIMQIAVAELRSFDNIPISVTLNEYIDLARYYSTPKSPTFINGILDAIVKDLKSEGLLFKS